MSLRLDNLDGETRKFMLDELNRDLAGGSIYISPRLNAQGAMEYPELLRSAIAFGDDSSLAASLRARHCLKTTEIRQTRNGPVEAKVPITAPETLAEGEFNRFYARGLCLRALSQGVPSLEIYRAKQVTNPRPDSVLKVGSLIHASQLLDDLRIHQGIEPALGVPPGPNSGLSVRIPSAVAQRVPGVS